MSVVTRAEERRARETRESLIERLAKTGQAAETAHAEAEAAGGSHPKASGAEAGAPVGGPAGAQSGNSAAIARMFVRESGPNACAPATRQSPRFAIDGARLAKHGILGPKIKRGRLRAEIRTVKHRLINRMNFFDRRERIGRRQENAVLITSVRPGCDSSLAKTLGTRSVPTP